MTSVVLAALVVVARCSCGVAALQSVKMPMEIKPGNHTFHLMLRIFQTSDCGAEITLKVFARSMQFFLCFPDAIVVVFLGIVQILLRFKVHCSRNSAWERPAFCTSMVMNNQSVLYRYFSSCIIH